jgi:hypothetical protein
MKKMQQAVHGSDVSAHPLRRSRLPILIHFASRRLTASRTRSLARLPPRTERFEVPATKPSNMSPAKPQQRNRNKHCTSLWKRTNDYCVPAAHGIRVRVLAENLRHVKLVTSPLV